jgi:hypothetical protein
MNTQQAIEIVVMGMRGCSRCNGEGLVEVSPESPTGDCPRCRVPGYKYRADGIDPDSRAEVQAAIALLEADARALADVRTLDDWKRKQPRQRDWKMHDKVKFGEGPHGCMLYEDREHHGEWGKNFDGSSEDEARAKAAAWVREQKAGAEGVSKIPDHMAETLSGDGTTRQLNLWYPRVAENPKFVELGLIDVRAADSICISYDFERDGWKIEQASVFEWAADDKVCDPGWKEVAFVQAWGLQPENACDSH